MEDTFFPKLQSTQKLWLCFGISDYMYPGYKQLGLISEFGSFEIIIVPHDLIEDATSRIQKGGGIVYLGYYQWIHKGVDKSFLLPVAYESIEKFEPLKQLAEMFSYIPKTKHDLFGSEEEQRYLLNEGFIEQYFNEIKDYNWPTFAPSESPIKTQLNRATVFAKKEDAIYPDYRTYSTGIQTIFDIPVYWYTHMNQSLKVNYFEWHVNALLSNIRGFWHHLISK